MANYCAEPLIHSGGNKCNESAQKIVQLCNMSAHSGRREEGEEKLVAAL